MVNRDEVVIDTTNGLIRNDTVWKDFSRAAIRSTSSTAFFASFKKRFGKTADGKFTGLTSDSDGRINARNTLEEITITKRKGSLELGNTFCCGISTIPARLLRHSK